MTNHLSLLFITLTLAAVIPLLLVSAQTTTTTTSAPSTTKAPVAVVVTCTRETACYPWSSRGPACARGSRMNLRFVGEAAPENGVNVSGIPGNVTEMTYAFCPIVDELQAFNLTNFTRLAGIYTKDDGATWKAGNVGKSYLSAIGFGNQTLRTIPPASSEGRVLILDNTADSPCNAGTSTGAIGFVNFLVLNVSMYNGLFVYLAGHENPPGNGFVPTCTSGDVCTIDPSQKCFGDVPGRKMCGKCYEPAELAKTTMQVWVSYYGTDVNGRTLRSGASNPMNFLKYSLVDVFSALSNTYNNIKNAQFTRPDLQVDNLGP